MCNKPQSCDFSRTGLIYVSDLIKLIHKPVEVLTCSLWHVLTTDLNDKMNNYQADYVIYTQN